MAIARLLHINDRSDSLAWQTLDAIRARCGYVPGVKVVNPDAYTLWKLRGDYGAELIVARLDVPGLTLEQGGRGWYDATARKVGEVGVISDYLEVPVNEKYPKPGEIERFADASAEYVRLAAGLGVKCIVGNFSVGTPEVADFPRFLPALEAAYEHGGALGLHEYGLPHNYGAGYWLGRWTEFYTVAAAYAEEVWELPCILTEFGIDGGLEKPERPRDTAGWRAYGLNGAQYAAWLDGAIAIEEERADDCGLNLLGACLFNCGDYADKKWHAFEVGDEPALAAWLAASPKESDVNEDLAVGDGVRRLMQERGDAPATHETYLGVPGAQVSLTVGVSGAMYLCTERNGWAITVYEPR